MVCVAHHLCARKRSPTLTLPSVQSVPGWEREPYIHYRICCSEANLDTPGTSKHQLAIVQNVRNGRHGLMWMEVWMKVCTTERDDHALTRIPPLSCPRPCVEVGKHWTSSKRSNSVADVWLPPGRQLRLRPVRGGPTCPFLGVFPPGLDLGCGSGRRPAP